MDKLYSISKTSEILDITPKTLRIWDKEGKLKPVLTSGGHRRYKESDIKKITGDFIENDSIIVDGLTNKAWDWMEPYFVAQGVCKESRTALKELFIEYMKKPQLPESIHE